MTRLAVVACVAALVGCGNSGIEGMLEWAQPPKVSGRSLHGVVRNTTSHSESIGAGSMRLLDDRGRKVAARIHVGARSLAAHASTPIDATWKAGKPVRLDYGAGTLAFPSD